MTKINRPVKDLQNSNYHATISKLLANKQSTSSLNIIQSIVDMDDYLNSSDGANKSDIRNEHLNILINESICI